MKLLLHHAIDLDLAPVASTEQADAGDLRTLTLFLQDALRAQNDSLLLCLTITTEKRIDTTKTLKATKTRWRATNKEINQDEQEHEDHREHPDNGDNVESPPRVRTDDLRGFAQQVEILFFPLVHWNHAVFWDLHAEQNCDARLSAIMHRPMCKR